MHRQHSAEDGSLVTPVALLIAVILFSLALYALFIPAGFDAGLSARAGMARATDAVIPDGGLTGFADSSGRIGPVPVENPLPQPSRLGGVLVPLRLASIRLSWQTGTGADLGNATV